GHGSLRSGSRTTAGHFLQVGDTVANAGVNLAPARLAGSAWIREPQCEALRRFERRSFFARGSRRAFLLRRSGSRAVRTPYTNVDQRLDTRRRRLRIRQHKPARLRGFRLKPTPGLEPGTPSLRGLIRRRPRSRQVARSRPVPGLLLDGGGDRRLE